MKNTVTTESLMEFIKEMNEYLYSIAPSIEDPQLKNTITTYYREYSSIENTYFLEKIKNKSNE